MTGASSLIIADPPAPVTDWPKEPYKGLNYYEPQDVPIFAGRGGDLSQCARLIGATSTRLFVLHGSTGCGKSSFLRAGLVPFLERRENDFLFVRDSEKKLPHFVRCTDDPFSRLAEMLHEIAKGSRILKQQLDGEDPTVIDFSQVLAVGSDLSGFINRIEPNELVDLFARLAARLPETLVVVLDQVEELFTLKSGRLGDGERQRFFQFMHAYLRTEMDLKIILTLRTEYFGRLLARLRRTAFDATLITDYLLTDLSVDQLKEAIERPTSDTPVGEFGVPQHVYRFKYSEKLSTDIANDLLDTVSSGGVLPIMQLVCSRLYSAARARGQEDVVEISKPDYDNVGGVEGQIEAHVKDSLRDLCLANKVNKGNIEIESTRWRKALRILTKTQVDGTVTTELVPSSTLAEEVERTGSTIVFNKDVANFLDACRIIRPVSVYNAIKSEEISCFVLGHDVIGLALKNWEKPGAARARLVSMRRLSGGVGIAIFAVVGAYSVVTGKTADSHDPLITVGGMYGMFFLAVYTNWGLRVVVEVFAGVFDAMAKLGTIAGFDGAAKAYRRMAANLRALRATVED
jgi:hypothetical protein